VLLSLASAPGSKNAIAPVGAVVFSPITDLALTGRSFYTRAEADRYFTKSQAGGLVRSYLGTADPKNPLASPLYADLRGVPPVRVHVGDEEVLLDDSIRFVERAVAAGADARLDLWMGMPHGFVTNVGEFNAAPEVHDCGDDVHGVDPHHVGHRHRVRCLEAHRRANGWRHLHVVRLGSGGLPGDLRNLEVVLRAEARPRQVADSRACRPAVAGGNAVTGCCHRQPAAQERQWSSAR